jgi:hypothetical protein
MKLNLFGGVFIFEGTYSEYTKLLGNVEKLGTKLVGIQTQLNRDTIKTQQDLVKSDPNLQIRYQPERQRPAGLQ